MFTSNKKIYIKYRVLYCILQKSVSKYIEGGMRHIQNHILNVEWQHEVSSKASEAELKLKLFINLRKNKD